MVSMRKTLSLLLFVSVGSTAMAATMSSSMIAEMREIKSVSRSPDGALAVIGLRHPNPRTNINELSWVIVSVDGKDKPITIAAGEDIWSPTDPGTLLTVPVQWSADGRWFFYLRRDGSTIQIWETDRTGRRTRQVSHSTSAVIGLKPSSKTDELLVELAPDPKVLQEAEDSESRNGILYDDHVIGSFSLTGTMPVLDRWRSVRVNDKGGWVPLGWTGTTHAVFDIRRLELKALPTTLPPLQSTAVASADNSLYHVAVVPTSEAPGGGDREYAGQYTLHLESKNPPAVPSVQCSLADCVANRLSIIGWSADGTEVVYLAASTSGRLGNRMPGMAALFAWDPALDRVRVLRDWGDIAYTVEGTFGPTIESPPIIGDELVVADAGLDEPPRLESINLSSGVSRTLFDPNLDLRTLTRGRAHWRSWPTSSPYPGRGVVILPDDYQAGQRYPVVITSYACGSGFLRGGSGDNAAEYVAAHQGFIVICVDVPIHEMIAKEPDWSQLYSIACSDVLDLVADLGRSGLADVSRVGLSGQSFGANFGAYCISHSHVIAAAAFRHGSAAERARWDLFDTAPLRRAPNGPYGLMHLPDPKHDPEGRWDAISSARRAHDIEAPTLIQDDELEYLNALPLWAAMHEERKRVEMYVFPEEGHVLTQPIHRLVNYERQLDWFNFWLNHKEDPDGSKKQQYEEWRRLRDATVPN